MDSSPVQLPSSDSSKYPKRYGNFHLRRQGLVAVATPSPNWKANLRQSCLDRAKQRRLDLVRRRRQQYDQPSNRMSNFMESTTDESGKFDNEEGTNARVLVEEELREHGVAMNLDERGCLSNDMKDRSSFTDLNGMTSAPQKQSMNSDYNYDDFISEEEIYDLMQEVEEMLNRDEELLLEEVLELERMDKQQMEHQIADYEKWVHDDNDVDDAIMSSSQDECIPCPLCQGGLISSVKSSPQSSFVCSNYRIGTCHFHTESYGLSLPQLFDRFRSVYDTHGLECPGQLTFGLENRSSDNAELMAVCNCCNLHVAVI